MASPTEETIATSSAEEAVGMEIPPPFLVGGTLILGLALQRLLPIKAVSSRLIRPAGVALATCGLGLAIASARSMGHAGTSTNPREPTTALVTSGPFRYSRNPIYLSFGLLYVGISAIAGAVWPLLLLPALLFALARSQIEREENYLEARFAERYRQYKERVPRWF